MTNSTKASWKEGRRGSSVIWANADKEDFDTALDIELRGADFGTIVIRDTLPTGGPAVFPRKHLLSIIRRADMVHFLVCRPLLPEADQFEDDEDLEMMNVRKPGHPICRWTVIISTHPDHIAKWRAFLDRHNSGAAVAVISDDRSEEMIFQEGDFLERQAAGFPERQP